MDTVRWVESDRSIAARIEHALVTLGARVVDVRRREIHRRVDGTVEGFDVTVTWADGRTAEELVWISDAVAPGMWRFPYDPALPGLAPLLGGDHAARSAAPDASVEVVSLRPLRSAVVRSGDRRLLRYAKVVPPGEVEALVLRHRVAAGTGVPVPAVLDVDAAWGVVWLSALPGAAQRPDLVARAAEEVVETVVRLCAGVSGPTGELLGDLRPAPTLWDQADHHAAMLTDLLPDVGVRARRVLDAAASSVRAPVLPGLVHGDLHDGQLLLADDAHDGAQVTGVLDLDTLGLGDAADDLARLAGRLLARGERAAAQRVLAAAKPLIGDTALGARVALALVVSAVDPWRMCDPAWRERASALVDLASRPQGYGA